MMNQQQYLQYLLTGPTVVVRALRHGTALALLLLAACSSSYRAPVDDATGGPRFLDDGRVHRVNAGETLYAVAWMYDLDPQALARANNLSEPYIISTGQLLSIDLRSAGIVSSRPAAAPAAAAATANGVTVSPVQGGSAISRAPLAGGLQRTPLPSRTLPADPVPEPPPVTPEPPRAAPAPAPAATPPAEAAVAAAPATPPPASPAPAPVATTTIPGPVLPSGPINWAWPGEGRILARFEESSVDKKGIDLAGNKGDPVRAAADGQVVYAGSGLLRYGDLIILKHNDQFLSAYAHNDRILVREGDFVKQGDRIADLGSSGIDRNMLHFEIRVEGTPVDPLLHLPSR